MGLEIQDGKAYDVNKVEMPVEELQNQVSRLDEQIVLLQAKKAEIESIIAQLGE